MKRRYQKRKEQRQIEKNNQIVKWGNEERTKGLSYFYIALGGIAVVTMCCSGVILYRTADHMEDLHAMNAPKEEETQTSTTEEAMTEIKEVVPEDTTTVESTEIKEEDIPLSASFLDEDEMRTFNWQCVVADSASASSVLQSEQQKSYEAINVLDDDPTTNWQEGEEGNGEGSELTFCFEEPVAITGLEILNGNGTSEEKYYANNRPKEITIQVGAKKVKYMLSDVYGLQRIALSPAIETKEMTITIESVYEGDKFSDTCISDIHFFTEK